MEECISENNYSKKRARDDSAELDVNSSESKRVNANTDSDPNSAESERVDTEIKPDSPESDKGHPDSGDKTAEVDSPEVVKFRDDILDILDVPEIVPEIQDLDSFIRSFEEEILQSSPLSQSPAIELTSDSGESQPELGYLLEASDDELGLPPTVPEAQAQNQPTNISIGDEGADNGLGDIVGYENELPSYDSFEFGLGEQATEGHNYDANGDGDFLTVDGLFDYSDGSDFTWRPESLPAL